MRAFIARAALQALAVAGWLSNRRGRTAARRITARGPGDRPTPSIPGCSQAPAAPAQAGAGAANAESELPAADGMTAVEMAVFAHTHDLCRWCPDPGSDPQYCPEVLEAVDQDAVEAALHRLRKPRHPPPA
ncbi:hypothetical protein ACFC26_17140 [Kitasatospora purpeofusca]|uniref:hypothetical protein n=1 Tax=Kitasatospora purpeofusca TaxID=67352 RepID=UPI0035DC166F